MADVAPLLAAGDRLPALEFPALPAGSTVPLRVEARVSALVVTLHAGCTACRSCADTLAGRTAELAEWDGRLVLVIAATAAAPEPTWPQGVLAARADPAALRAAGIPVPAVLVSDQWGELHAVEPAGPEHEFLAADEVVAWARYLSISCPECEGEAL